ncbi:MAG: 50S ribosomal protein L25 [Fimbriimonas sp.]
MSMFQVEPRLREGAKPKQLRKKGLLPMALVERTHETMLLQAPANDLQEAMRHLDGHGAMELQINGENGPRKAIVKRIEKDALRQELIHVTLQEVSDDDQVKMDLPIILRGHSEDEGEGVSITQTLDSLKVRGKLRDMPDHVEVNVDGLTVGHHIDAGQISLPEGIESLTPADATVVTVTLIREPVLEVPNETEAETGEIGAEGAPSAAPGESGGGGTASEDGR